MATYRITHARDPETEIEQAKEFIDRNGYCFWACHPNQTFDYDLIVFRKNTDDNPGSYSEGAYGILKVSGYIDKTPEMQSQLIAGMPSQWVDSGEVENFKRFARVTEILQVKIPVTLIFSVNSGELLKPTQLHANGRIRVNHS